MSKWQPIHSCPKDGTPFEALFDDFTIEAGVYWSDERYCILGAPMGSKGPGCMSPEAGLPVEPTDWRPLAALATKRD